MTCAREADILRLKTGELDPAAVRALDDHAKTCATCGEALELLVASRNVLVDARLELPGHLQSRMWRNINGLRHRQERKTQAAWNFALGFASATAVLVLFLVYLSRHSAEPSLSERPQASHRVVEGLVAIGPGATRLQKNDVLRPHSAMRILSPSTLLLGKAEVSASPGSKLRTDALARERCCGVLHLLEGRLTAAVLPLDRDKDERFAVVTRSARVEVVGTRFTVSVSGSKTLIAVEEGTVAVSPQAGERFLLKAGERAEVPQSSPAVGALQNTEEERELSDREPSSRALRLLRRAQVAELKAVEPTEPTGRQVPASPHGADVPRLEPGALRLSFDEKSRTHAVRVTQDRTLRRARDVLTSDAKKARALAEEVLDRKPPPGIEVDALAVLADALRYDGHLREAAVAYEKVALHKNGQAYAEEALLRRALILQKLVVISGALEALALADWRFPRGTLRPERVALAAELYLASGDPLQAAKVLRSLAPHRATLATYRRRVEVAEALIEMARDADAVSLVRPVLEAEIPDWLRQRAQKVFEKVATKK